MDPNLVVNKYMNSTHQNGSTTVEAAFTLTALIGLVSFVFVVAYLFIAKITVTDTGYQSLICAAKRQSISSCLLKGKERLSSSLPFGETDHFQIKNSKGRFRVQVLWSFLGKYKIHYKKSLRY